MSKTFRLGIIVGILVFIGVIALSMLDIYGERPMEGIIGKEAKKVTKLQFDSEDGERRIVVTDKKAIAAFIKRLDGMVVKKCYIQPSLVVALKPVKLYIGSKLYKELDLCDTKDFIDVSFTRYEVVKGSMSSFDIKAFEGTFGFTI